MSKRRRRVRRCCDRTSECGCRNGNQFSSICTNPCCALILLIILQRTCLLENKNAFLLILIFIVCCCCKGRNVETPARGCCC
ncbi:hypothetical protein K2F40_02720 [Clostridium sp. CM028]|uniref:hypothetical protein n=1 Tax=Clostridium TaxID=1485 RepID=UPI0013EE5EF3|nr:MULTISPECIES: hypothetical protein [Clostridium]MBU3090853.1 hypothetical protein [Clostridium sp. CF011]MBW9144580.1 hypothetical protein [Clostridium sp. CM027]MBW9147894.1 hypothetical protein [Clostridium sp. CM028]MBZ9609043.1 hypothetical protein [Clostridium estertheticum]UVE40659.1 hypothetical protein KTC92_16440 [Clostridium sp. CM027]